jgi:uncharacterized membrane protein YeaQ/YmgE (transglycosylase-associated protein family)
MSWWSWLLSGIVAGWLAAWLTIFGVVGLIAVLGLGGNGTAKKPLDYPDRN